ncbi:MAG: hypothetical protein OHK0028_18540 [Deltaproteobacteria bacterium]
MFLLRREYLDGAEAPEIVLLHAEVNPQWGASGPPRRFTRVVVPSTVPGRRLAYLALPEPPEGERVAVRYRFSVVRGGQESFSPPYEIAIPSDEAIADLFRIAEEEGGNLPPAPGLGFFRTALPSGHGERAGGRVRFGFGAMRKKPSPSLCRASVDSGNGPPPVIEAPEALAVLKDRPMPYFLYHVSADGVLRSDKIASARVTLPDPPGEAVSARLVWGDPEWRAVNFSLLRAKGEAPGPAAASAEFFAPDRGAFLAAREEALSRLPLPRVFEGFVFGPSGSRVEYCFQIVVRRPDGGFEVRWRNREGGGNWAVTL